MQADNENVVRQIEEELERIKKEKPDSWGEIDLIVRNNLVDGRLEKFLESGTTQTVAEYVQRVEKYYEESHTYIKALEAGETELWEQLLRRLGKWAYNFLAKKGVPKEFDRYQIAEDCANEAGARLAHAHFPYDVDYDRWACILTHYVCLNYIRNHTEKIEVVDFDLSETAEWLEKFSNPSRTSKTDDRIDMLNAIDELSSEDRKSFILMYYFEGKDFDEIAVVLDRTKNALYKLHFDALENLRKILGEKGK